MPASTIILRRLSLANFKGIRELTVNFEGDATSIYGANGLGKTSIADAFYWVLFGKDSAGNASFEIKPLDESGEPEHRLMHEVEAELVVDGRTITLKKVYMETWQGVRGQETFTGHTTKHVINKVPCQEQEYKRQVADICDEKTLRILIDPFYFNRTMKWQDRRAALLDLCGDISDADVFASSAELAALPELMEAETVDKSRAIALNVLKETKKEIEGIPLRIDEVRKSLPEVTGTIEECDTRRQELEAKRSELQNQLARIDNGGEIAEKRKQIALNETEILNLRNALKIGAGDGLAKERLALNDLNTKADEAARRVRQISAEIEDTKTAVARYTEQVKICEAAWDQVDETTFTAPEQETVCPTCLQELPAEQLAAARQKAEAAFNIDKANKLERATANGRTAKSNRDNAQAKLEKLEADLKEAQEAAEVAKETAEAEQKRLKELQETTVAAPQSTPEIEKIEEANKVLTEEITKLQQGSQEEQGKIKNAILRLNDDLNEVATQKERIQRKAEGEARLAELDAREKELVGIREKNQRVDYLSQVFMRAKADLLTNRINAKFDLVRFKLFEVLVNGNTEDTCICTIDGVPYEGALSTSQRINAGLDVINAFARHLGITAPVFIDNCESISSPIATLGQQIRLIVSPSDQALRVQNDAQPAELIA
jgi:DNA repair exonuclease SbcCD ATPase subunit